MRGADQDSSESRTLITTTEIVPGASPTIRRATRAPTGTPRSGLRWHASALPLGPGVLEFPRQQGNVAATWFLPQNELKFGVDYQDVKWESLNIVPDRYMGAGYNPSLPGGFVTPATKNVYRAIDSPVDTSSTNLAGFASDRIEVGDRWIFNLGVRYEDQVHENDLGQEVLSSEDFTPRLAAIFDVGADGSFLVKATAGRYLTHITQEFINAEFSTLPNGANSFDQFRWNPATRRYDLFVRTQLPPAGTRLVDVEPYYKDEVTAGIEWQMTPNWALDARAIWWTVDEPYSATDQFNAQGQVFRLLTNFEDAEREYQGLQIEANRAFRDGWLIRTNYTLSKVEGNAMGQEHFNNTIDDFREAQTILDPATGLPVTVVNRFGRLDNDRKHIANLSGAKSFEMTERQHLTFGAWFTYRTGKPWGLRPQRRPARRRSARRPSPPPLHPAARRQRARGRVRAQPHRSLGVPDRESGVRQPARRGGERHRRAGADRGQPARPGCRSRCVSRSRSRARCGSSRASGLLRARRRHAAAARRERAGLRATATIPTARAGFRARPHRVWIRPARAVDCARHGHAGAPVRRRQRPRGTNARSSPACCSPISFVTISG